MLRIFQRFQDPKAQIRKVIGNFELPAFPASTQRVLGVLRDPEVNGRSVASALSEDPALSVAVLKTVNSPAFGLPNKVDSIGQAVTLLGFSAVESIVLGQAITKALPQPNCVGFEVERFWRAASARGAAARALAKRIHPQTANEAYTAALLQDMAIPLLAEHKGAIYGDLLQQWHNGSDELIHLEQQALHLDHAEIASWMAVEWNLPDAIASAISEHHRGDSDAERSALPAVSLVASLRETEFLAGLDEVIARAERAFGLLADDTRTLLESACLNPSIA